MEIRILNHDEYVDSCAKAGIPAVRIRSEDEIEELAKRKIEETIPELAIGQTELFSLMNETIEELFQCERKDDGKIAVSFLFVD